jgi:acetyl esterase/lipase
MLSIRMLMKILAAVPVVLLGLSGCTALTVYNDLVPQDRASEIARHDIAYGSEHRQKLDIYVPAKNVAGRDVIVFFYGGSWKLGRKEEVSFVANALTQRGYVVVVPDYRLVPEVTYPAFVDDTAKAVAWTYRNIATYGGNPNRLFISGHSAGAYNAMMVALAPEFLDRQGLSPSILKGVIGISGPYDFLPFQYVTLHRTFDSAAPNLAATQPINRVSDARNTPPVLLLAGSKETLVPPKNPRELAAVLKKAGKPVEVKFYPGARHLDMLFAFSKTGRSKASVLDDMVAWISSH